MATVDQFYHTFFSHQTIQWLGHLLFSVAIMAIIVSEIDCKTAPSFARNPKIGVFDRVLVRGREMGERGEEGIARPASLPISFFPCYMLARLLPRPVLPFHDRAPKLDLRISGEKKPGLFCSLYLKHKSLMVIHFPSGTPAVFWAWTHETTILIMLKYV